MRFGIAEGVEMLRGSDHEIDLPALLELMAYRDPDWPAAKSVALLRKQYGGHRIYRTDEDEERR